MSGAAVVAAARGVSVRYGRTVALDDVSIAVEAGGVVALLGRNGAGKSSLVRCLLGQQRPDEGRAELFGADAWRTRTDAMRRVGVVPETPDVPPTMTARQIERFCAGVYPRWDSAAVLSRLARFGVPTGTPAGRLSKGQKAQLSLALALGHAPELLVLDDPTLGLDAVARRAVFEELVDELAARGSTVFLTTHDLAGVEGIADRVAILVEGRLTVDEALERLKARFRRLRAPSGSTPWPPFTVVRDERAAWGETRVVSDFTDDAFGRWAASSGDSVAVEAMSLEEIFVALAGETGGAR